MDGLSQWYFRRSILNVQLGFKGNYKDGKKDGIWDYFNEDGSRKKTETWKDGKKDGIWEYFNKNGDLISTVTWRDDEKIDDAKHYPSGYPSK